MRRCLENGRALQEVLQEAAPRYLQRSSDNEPRGKKKVEAGAMRRSAEPQFSFADLGAATPTEWGKSRSANFTRPHGSFGYAPRISRADPPCTTS